MANGKLEDGITGDPYGKIGQTSGFENDKQGPKGPGASKSHPGPNNTGFAYEAILGPPIRPTDTGTY